MTDETGAASQTEEFTRLQENILKLNDGWRKTNPQAITRDDDDNERGAIVSAADVAGFSRGSKFNFMAGVAIGAACSLVAYLVSDDDDYTASIDWEGVKRNDWVLANNGKTATAIDSAGFFHNEIILNIGKEKLSKATVNDVEQLVVESAVELYGNDAQIPTIDEMKHDEGLRFIKANIGRLNASSTPTAYCTILGESNSFNKQELGIVQVYLNGLQTIDNTNGNYTKAVLNEIDNANLSPKTIVNLRANILLGNASNKLWTGR